ncbi:MAG: GNAT family N-acetyltransferase [Oscillospiraceae bacterium]|nr:GNAT family N-acetyltransferase [Oscillospiraceae bacterium]
MQNAGKTEIFKILKNNMDFVLEFDTVCESSKKPVYTFQNAFTGNIEVPEFCLVYAEIDDSCDLNEIYVSVNSSGLDFDLKCREKIYNLLIKHRSLNLILHNNDNIKNLLLKNYKDIEIEESDFCESFYFSDCEATGFPCPARNLNANIRSLTASDGNLDECFIDENNDYLPEIFDYMIRDPVYDDCGIIGEFDEDNNFIGYIAYYGIGEKIRDVSYIYVGEKYRGKNYGTDLLNFFEHKNIRENKISYYSYADGEISKHLIKSSGFSPCAGRYEINIKLKNGE